MPTAALILSLTLWAGPEQKADEAKDPEPAILKMKPLADDPKDDALRKLLKERFNAALTEVQALYVARTFTGFSGVEGFFDAGSRLKHAGLEAFDDPKDKIAFLEKYVELAKQLEKITEVKHSAGRIGVAEVQHVRYHRADAEIALLRLKGKSGEKPK
jgi:hypothetical protein